MQKSNHGLIITPYGPVPESLVIQLTDNESIGTSPDGNLLLKDKTTGSIIRDYGKAPTEVLTTFDTHGRVQNRRLNKGVNYPGYTIVADAEKILSFSTTWIVPDEPKNPRSDVTFFLWNGLSGGALQPVLQWGNGSAMYQIANWAFVNGRYVHGTYLPVAPGEKLTGIITFNKKDEDGWHYTGSFVNYPKADLNVVRDSEAQGVIQCFESYTTNLDEIPANLCTRMEHICLKRQPAASYFPHPESIPVDLDAAHPTSSVTWTMKKESVSNSSLKKAAVSNPLRIEIDKSATTQWRVNSEIKNVSEESVDINGVSYSFVSYVDVEEQSSANIWGDGLPDNKTINEVDLGGGTKKTTITFDWGQTHLLEKGSSQPVIFLVGNGPLQSPDDLKDLVATPHTPVTQYTIKLQSPALPDIELQSIPPTVRLTNDSGYDNRITLEWGTEKKVANLSAGNYQVLPQPIEIAFPDKLNWVVTGGTPLPTPSGKNTVIVNDSASQGEIDFYFH